MTDVRRKSKNPPQSAKAFAVFVDTNAIYTDEKSIALFPEAFRAWWKEMCAGADIRLVIPELVYNELHQQKTLHAWKHYNEAQAAIRNIEGRLGVKPKKTRILTREQIRQTIDKALRRQLQATAQCHLEPIPYDDIAGDNLKAIIHNAVWRIPPFKSGREGEGLRDAIVLETLKAFSARNPHADIIFMSHDKTLYEAATRLAAQARNIVIFKEPATAGAYINAARTKFSSAFLHAVIADAGKLIKSLEASGFGRAVVGKLIEQFSLQRGAYGASYVCDGNPAFYVLGTDFLSIVGDDAFHWQTTLGIVCDYTPQTAIMGAERQQGKIRQIAVQLEWTAKVDAKRQFGNPTLLAVRTLKDEYLPAEDFEPYIV